MRTFKISVIATLAAILAWGVRVPQRMWPSHPRFADFLLALILCLVLQFTWAADPKSRTEKKSV